MEDGKFVDGSVWFYAPNKGAPVFFAVGFLVSGIFHIYQCIHYKSWRLTGLYVTTALIFTAGFITREIAAFDYQDLIKYIVAVVLIYSAPPIFELGNYQALGRILYYVPYFSPVHPGRVLTTFAFLSALVETFNGRGASLVANTSLSADLQAQGAAFFKAALVMQLAIVCAFLLLAGYFHHRCVKAGTFNSNIRNALITLYASSAILTVRTIFRTVEYFSISKLNYHDPNIDPNTFSPLLRYEWFFYVFEASLMLINSWLLNIRHPRKYLPKSTKTYLSRDGVTEITGPGYKDTRPFIITLVDPFDLIGLVTGASKKNRFWENEEGIRHENGATPPKTEASSGNRDAEGRV